MAVPAPVGKMLQACGVSASVTAMAGWWLARRGAGARR